MKTDPPKIRAWRPNGRGEPQVVQTAFGAAPGRLLERLMVVTAALLQYPEVAELVSYVTYNTERQLVLVGSQVPLHLSAELALQPQLQQRRQRLPLAAPPVQRLQHLRRRVARVGLAHQPLQRPVQDNFKQWAERARCTDAPKKDAPRGNTTCERYTQCDPSVPEVTLCTVQGLAHDWPGEKDGLAATPALLDFFGRVRRPR